MYNGRYVQAADRWFLGKPAGGSQTRRPASKVRAIAVTANDALADVRRLHAELGRTVEQARPVFSALALPSDRTPEREALTAILESTAVLASTLAALLERLDRLLGHDELSPDRDVASWEEVRALLRELEPERPEPSAFHPCVARRDTPIGLLPSFYGALLPIDNALTRSRIPKSFVWRETVELWVSFVYLGGTHASGGLLSRLDRIGQLAQLEEFPSAHEAPGPQPLPGARRRRNPWDAHDIGQLRRIAERATFLVTASAESLASEHRRVWCEGIDDWLRAEPKALAQCGPILAGWVDEAPALHPSVVERLGKIIGNVAIASDVRWRAQEKLRGSGI